MGDSIEEDQLIKTSEDKFIQDIGDLEYNHNNDGGNIMGRMSLYKQFDPLINQTNNSIHVPNNNSNSNININNNQSIDVGDDGEHLNQSGTLIHLNTPMKITNKERENVNEIDNKNELEQNIISMNNQANGNHNFFVESDSNNQQIVQMNEEIGILETKNEDLEQLIGKLILINENVVESATKKITNFQEIIENKEQEINKLLLIKNQLEEDLNNVEKSYYEIHSKYNDLRSIVQEMDQRETQNKTRIQDLSKKLKEKELEYRKIKHQAEEAIENANQRMQTAANNESISLKAQIKVLEMRVNSLQSQIEQKNIENQELSNIVNELIASNNTGSN